MLTPQEVSERVFPKVSFGGYGMPQVDEFLDLLTEDYGSLYNENAVLKSKMKLLVEKVEEYRSTEAAMRKALMTAQRMADDLVKDAQVKHDAMIHEAEQAALARVAEVRREREAEEFRLASAQRVTGDYVRQVRALHDYALDYLDGLAQITPAPEEPKPEDTVETAAAEIDEHVQRLLAQAVADVNVEVAKSAAEEPTDDAPQEEASTDTGDDGSAVDPDAPQAEDFVGRGDYNSDDAPTTRIDFGSLKFGRDYEIK